MDHAYQIFLLAESSAEPAHKWEIADLISKILLYCCGTKLRLSTMVDPIHGIDLSGFIIMPTNIYRSEMKAKGCDAVWHGVNIFVLEEIP
jgi:hypothetical protein